MTDTPPTDEPLHTPLHAFHVSHGAKIVPFAGYAMPLNYAPGILKEHLHTRSACGLFDVSHMGQVIIRARSGDNADAARALEALIPADVEGLAEGRQRYGLLTAPDGGILDDLMLVNRGTDFFVVVNAARKAHDLAHLRAGLVGCDVIEVTDRALLALQGPAAESVLAGLVDGVAAMRFMDHQCFDSAFGPLWVSRSGYTGEDGFEISVAADQAHALAEALVAADVCWPIGLGARDSLRLEAGLCLYGHDMDETVTPAEASLGWAIPKVRRTGGVRAGGFAGDTVILGQLAEGPGRRRVGLKPEGRAPIREGADLFAVETGGDAIGRVTSGAFGPSVDGPVAMGLVASAHATVGGRLFADVRGRRLPLAVVALPFVQPGFKR